MGENHIPLLFVACILTFSCQKAPELSVTSPSSIDLSVDGGIGSITFTANRNWKASSSDSWVIVSPMSGEASDKPVTVNVHCNANTTYEDRTASVTIRMEELSKTVTIKQSANLDIILSTQSYEKTSAAGTLEVTIQTNVQYSVATTATWVKQIDTKGLVTDKLIFSIEENKTYEARSASITISGSGLSKSITVQQEGKKPVPEGAIDLGLSVYWATCNIGASRPEQYGEYFAWGEIKTKTNYNWEYYEWCNGFSYSLTKYNSDRSMGTVDNKTQLERADDVASVKMGERWRMPTAEEWTELKENCSWSIVSQNGVKGYEVTSNTKSNSIFLPAAGFKRGMTLELEGYMGCYWSSSHDVNLSDAARALTFYSSQGSAPSYNVSREERYLGFSIRAVADK